MIIPCLDPLMQQAQATNESLANAAGVSRGTVYNARHGRAVFVANGLAILQAIKTVQFAYKSKAGLNRLRRKYDSCSTDI